MKDYLIHVAYTSQAMATLVANPQNREEMVRASIENLGGSLKTAYFAFGDYDVILIVSMPSDVEAAAIALAFAAGGALKTVKTTPLLSMADTIEALKKASTCGYKPVTGAATAGA